MAKKHGLYAVQFDTGTDVLLGGITQMSIPQGITTRAEPQSGDVLPLASSIVQRQPVVSFSTSSISLALDQLGAVGLSIQSLATGLNLWGQLHVEEAQRAAAATNHINWQFVRGLIIPRVLSASQGQDAALSVELHGSKTAGTDIITSADSQTAPTGFVNNERFTLGPVTISGVVIPQVRSINLDFGIQIASESWDGDVDPNWINIATIQPVLTIRGIDVSLLSGATALNNIDGAPATQANSSINFRRYEPNAEIYANASLQHVHITIAGHAYWSTLFDANGDDAGEVELTIVGVKGAADPILIITTDVAIS